MNKNQDQNNLRKSLRGRGRPRKLVKIPEEIFSEICHGDLDVGLTDISKFKESVISSKNPNGLLGLYILCLCEITFDESPQKDKVRRIKAIVNHLLKKSEIDFPVNFEHRILPSCLIFKMACIWDEWGLKDYKFFYSFGTSRVNFQWIDRLPSFNPNQASVLDVILTTIQSFDNGNIMNWWFDDWIGTIETSVSVKLADSGYFKEAMDWLRRIKERNYPSELAIAGIASAYAFHGKSDIAGSLMSRLVNTSAEAIKGELKGLNLNNVRQSIIRSFCQQNLIADAKNYIASLENISEKNSLWGFLAKILAESQEIRESLFCLEQRQYPGGRRFHYSHDILRDLEVADIYLENNCRTIAMGILKDIEGLSQSITEVSPDSIDYIAKLSTSFFKASELILSEQCLERVMIPDPKILSFVDDTGEIFSIGEVDFDFNHSMVSVVEELMAQNKPLAALACIDEIKEDMDCRNEAYFCMAEHMAENGLRREMKYLFDKIDLADRDFYPERSAKSLDSRYGVEIAFECLRHPNIGINGMHALISHYTLLGEYSKAVYVFKRFVLEVFLKEDYRLG